MKAFEYANSIGGDTLAEVGYDGRIVKELAKAVVWVESFDMQLCVDVYLMFGHMVMKGEDFSTSSCSLAKPRELKSINTY